MKHYLRTMCMCIFFISQSLIGFGQCDPQPTINGDSLLCPNSTGTLMTQEYDSYQWYKRGFRDTAFSPIPGATSRTLTVDYREDVLNFFQVEITEDTCTATSEEILVDGYVFLLPAVRSTGDFEIDPNNGNSILCEGDTMYFTLLQPYDTSITWFRNGNPIQGENDTTLVVTEGGDYTAQGAPSICPNYIQGLGVTLTVRLEDCSTNSKAPTFDDLQVYPNPVSDILYIKDYSTVENMEIYNMAGLRVANYNQQDLGPQINMQTYPSGVYMLKLNISGQIVVRKLVVR